MSGLAFYDWENQELIRRIEITPKAVYWSENGELVSIATEDSYYVLRFNESAYGAAKEKETKEGFTEDGFEDAFDVNLFFIPLILEQYLLLYFTNELTISIFL